MEDMLELEVEKKIIFNLTSNMCKKINSNE